MKYEGVVYRPPSEAASLILQAAIGCAHNRCTFCTMYKNKQFRIRSMQEIEDDIKYAKNRWGDSIRRIFLADGDALVIPTEQLLQILAKLNKAFPSAERIASYGAPNDVLRKSEIELTALAASGLDMIYIGLESGDEETLKHVNKGASAEEIIEACRKLRAAGIRTSVTLISGLGGRKRLNEHAVKSADAISRIKPDYLGFLTLLLEPGAPLLGELETGEFELLNPFEVLKEMELFLEHVDSNGTVFRANHASNYVILEGNLNRDIPAMLAAVRKAADNRMVRDDRWRLL